MFRRWEVFSNIRKTAALRMIPAVAKFLMALAKGQIKGRGQTAPLE
jgi:hypothetical protein